MPSVDDNPFAEVERELSELERLCGIMERALNRRAWSDLDQAQADARRTTHALEKALETAPFRTAAFDAELQTRLRHVFAIRENQMARLAHYRIAVNERLQLLGRWRQRLRQIARRAPQTQRSALDRLS